MSKLLAILYAVCQFGLAYVNRKQPSELELQRRAFGKRHKEIENAIQNYKTPQQDAIHRGNDALVNNISDRMSNLKTEDTTNGYKLGLAFYNSKRDDSPDNAG
jgi:hypothetical protein